MLKIKIPSAQVRLMAHLWDAMSELDIVDRVSIVTINQQSFTLTTDGSRPRRIADDELKSLEERFRDGILVELHVNNYVETQFYKVLPEYQEERTVRGLTDLIARVIGNGNFQAWAVS